MKKHTIQEWANFTGLFIAQDGLCGDVYGYEKKPIWTHSWWIGEPIIKIPCEVISNFNTYDYRKITSHKEE